MEISDIEESDFEPVLALNEDSIPHVSRIGAQELRWFADNAAYVRVAKIEQKMAGFLIGLRPGTSYQSPNYRWFCQNYEDFAYIDRVAVSEWARRRGVADALYDDFNRTQSPVPRMTCEVNTRPANEGSMKFHQRLGFRQVGSQEAEGGAKEVAFLEKKL